MLIMNSPTEKSKGKAYLQEPQKSVRSMFNQNKEKDENDKMLMKAIIRDTQSNEAHSRMANAHLSRRTRMKLFPGTLILCENQVVWSLISVCLFVFP